MLYVNYLTSFQYITKRGFVKGTVTRTIINRARKPIYFARTRIINQCVTPVTPPARVIESRSWSRDCIAGIEFIGELTP